MKGSQLYVAEITDRCRKSWGNGRDNPDNEGCSDRACESLQAFDEAVRRLRKAFIDTVEGRVKNDCDENVSFHLGLSLQDHRYEPDESIVKLLVSIGGVKVDPSTLTKEQLAKVLAQVKEIASSIE